MKVEWNDNEGFRKQQNVIANLTTEQRRENGRKGGLAKGKKAKEKREAKAILSTFLSMSLKSGKVADIDSIKSFMALKGKNISVNEALQLQLVQKALKGDLSAYQTVMSMIGEKPADKIDVTNYKPVIINGENDLEE